MHTLHMHCNALKHRAGFPKARAISEMQTSNGSDLDKNGSVRRLLEDLQVPTGAWLLHYDASSVLGRVLIRMAKARGINIISVVRRPEAVAELEHIGCVP